MSIRKLSAGLAVVLALAGPVQAQRDAWELLGQGRVGIGQDRDVITLGHSEAFYRDKAYRRLRFAVEGGEVRMRAIRLYYLNGHAEDIEVSRRLQPGEQFDLDLRGERSYLQRIEMSYSGRPTISFGSGGISIGQASVRVYGENARWRGGPPAPPPPSFGGQAAHGGEQRGGWVEIGRERFDRQSPSVVIDVGRQAGRFGQIRLRNDGEAITLREVEVQFRNGSTQRTRIDQELGEGQETRRIDLEGERRSIQQIALVLEPRRRPGAAVITVLGTERPGREEGGQSGGYSGGRGDWVPLGEQSVGFGVDRDVIRVSHTDWSRGFGRLHFLVEGNDIHFQQVEVTYQNGFTERFPIDQNVRAGTDVPIDLGNGRSYISQIAMVYRSRPGFGGRAVVKVYGEPGRGRR